MIALFVPFAYYKEANIPAMYFFTNKMNNFCRFGIILGGQWAIISHKKVHNIICLGPFWVIFGGRWAIFVSKNLVRVRGYLHETSKYGRTTRIWCRTTQNLSDDKSSSIFVIRPNLCCPTQNAYRLVQNSCRPAQNSFRPTQNSFRPTQNSCRPAQNSCRPTQNVCLA
jgi:hypothetical protein